MTDYNTLLDVNLHGVVYTAQAAARHMKRRRAGSIVTTASTAGLRNDPFTPYSYAIAKAARHQLHQAGGARPGPLGRAGERDRAGPVPDEHRRQGARCRRRRTPCGTRSSRSAGWATRREIRGLALLLASPAGSFMTGGVYPIDGGALLQGPSLPAAGE